MLRSMALAATIDPRPLALSARDRRIVDHALRTLPPGADFGEALRALRDAVAAHIPNGRVFVLGTTDAGPIVGSIVSGVGIVDSERGVELVRVAPGGACARLGRFAGRG